MENKVSILSPVGPKSESSSGEWPVFASTIAAGFPSPADDYIESRIDLNEYLVQHKEATFFLRVQGNSMTGLGILNNDLLVVDRSLPVGDGNIVIAAIGGEFTVKQLVYSQKGCVLKAANPAHQDIIINSEDDLEVWGVVRWAIHKLWP